jgi:hypothetical protein
LQTAGVQLAPAVQETQLPFEHTRLVPQLVPLESDDPVSVHDGMPPVHESVPLWHGFAGWHELPAAHAMQVPLLQTMLVPHDVPLLAFPVTLHVDVPVAHDVTPVLQTLLPGTHAALAVQDTQLPLEQTRLVPHVVPLERAVLVSVHDGVPPVHDSVPAWHLFAGAQLVPAAQAMHAPLLQTMLLPQVRPSAALPVAVQTELPVAQDVVPTLQTIPSGVHARFCGQSMHAP